VFAGAPAITEERPTEALSEIAEWRNLSSREEQD